MPPVNTSAQNPEQYHIKLIHATKQNSMSEPIQLAFAVNDGDQEQVITAEVSADQLFQLCEEQGWLQKQPVRPIRSVGRRSSQVA